jgi:hypothetical protein
MTLPEKLPGLRILSLLAAVAFIVWIIPEGDIRQTVVLAMLLSIAAAGQLWQHRLAGRHLSLRRWLLMTALTGLLVGLGTAVLALLLMVIKTGLHGHGPEFTAEEFDWVLRQAVVWTLAGLLAGVGAGALAAALRAEPT